MTAETLREAARVLRERAEDATPGPWQPKAGMVSCVLGPREPEDHGGGLSSILRANLPMINGQERRQANVTYAATVHPGVGLALADWLDVEAYHVESHECAAQCEPDGCERVEKATSVARAILGESA